MPEAWKLPIRVGAALLKHYAAKAVGDETVKILAEEALDAGRDSAIAKIDDWLNGARAKKQMQTALARAAEEFLRQPSAHALQVAGFAWQDSPEINRALEGLAKATDETELRVAIGRAFRAGSTGRLSEAAVALASDEFLRCLRRSLLPLREAGPAVVNQAVLRMDEAMAGLQRTANDLQQQMKRTEDSLNQFIMRWQNEADLSLQRAFIDYSAYIADKSRDFVGRRAVFDAFDQFLKEPSGYFVVRGDPGIGKSALVAQLVRDRRYPHHFNIAAEGISTARQFFLNASAQLIACHGLAHMSLPADAGRDGGFFRHVLTEAAKASPAVILAIDALDEVSEPDRDPRANPLLLPASLPAGVHILVSTRRTDRAAELQAEHVRAFELVADSASNMGDITEYIEAYAKRPAMTVRLQELKVGHDDFVATLRDKSEGNFMYLRYVLPAIEDRRFPLDNVAELPRGLAAYYQSHWEKMRGRDARTFVRVNQKVIACLATAHRPISVDFIAKVTKLSAAQVRWTLDEWHEFLHQSAGAERAEYRIYHASYRDFLSAQVAG